MRYKTLDFETLLRIILAIENDCKKFGKGSLTTTLLEQKTILSKRPSTTKYTSICF